jgi:hypothetical protein
VLQPRSTLPGAASRQHRLAKGCTPAGEIRKPCATSRQMRVLAHQPKPGRNRRVHRQPVRERLLPPFSA